MRRVPLFSLFSVAVGLVSFVAAPTLTAQYMASSNSSPTLGAAGEQAAADFYFSKGYAVVARNYRHGRAEIDLIVQQAQPPRLVFVEVKVRSDLRYGFPEEFVTPAQQQRIRRAAEQFMRLHDWQGAIRFDILSLTPNSAGFRVDWFEDAF